MAAKMYDIEPYEVFKIPTKGSLVDKYGNDLTPTKVNISLKERYIEELTKIDLQDFIKSFKWMFLNNYQLKMSDEEVERLIYYRGQLILFYYKPINRFLLLPYTMIGGLDFYNREVEVRPIPMSTSYEMLNDPKHIMGVDEKLLAEYPLKIVRDASDIPLDEEERLHCGVILRDLTPDFNTNRIISPYIGQQPIIDAESDIIPFVRTNLLAGLGIQALTTQSDEEGNVKKLNEALYRSALSGKLFISTQIPIEPKVITNLAGMKKSDEYWFALQSLETQRLKQLGLGAGTMWDKKGTILQSEFQANASQTERIYNSRLSARQQFCTLVTLLFRRPVWCMESETVTQNDLNRDGRVIDSKEEDTQGDTQDVQTNQI